MTDQSNLADLAVAKKLGCDVDDDSYRALAVQRFQVNAPSIAVT